MARYVVTTDQRREIASRMDQIMRLINRPRGSPFDPEIVLGKLKLIIESAPPSAAPTGSSTPAQAEAIMGSAFYSVDTLKRYFGVKLFAKESALLATVPFSQPLLEQSRTTHMLVAGLPISIMDLRAKVPKAFYFNTPWYAEEDFALKRVKTSWFLIGMDAVPGSTSKTWAEQEAGRGDDEFTPGIGELALAVTLHYMRTGEHLFRSVYVRTRDVDSRGHHVGVGRNGSQGLRIRSWGDLRDYYIGLASARKSSWSRRAG